MPSEELEVTVGDTSGGISDGDTRTGTITGTNVREMEFDGDTVTYYDIEIDDNDMEKFSFSPSFPANVTPNTDLGKCLERFGVQLTVGETVKLHETFSAGTQVEFEVEEVDGEGDNTFINCLRNTLRPKGGEKPEPNPEPETDPDNDGDADASEDSTTDGFDQEVLDAVEANEGKPKSDIQKALVRDYGADHLQRFKAMIGDEIETVEDGDETRVFLGGE